VSRRVLAVLLSAATLVALAVPSSAAGAATTVTKLKAQVGSGSIAVSGAATFGPESPVALATDPAGDEPGDPAGAQAGIDMIGAQIYQPDPAKPLVQFAWQVAQLPPTGSVPEVVRYIFDILVNGGPASGGSEYLIQAKYSNVVSSTVTDDPQGHLMHIPGAFQIRGHCAVVGVINSCPHLAWLEGAFDVTHGVVYIGIPLGQSYAPDLAPGAIFTPNTANGYDTAACFQAAISNANLCDESTWIPASYTVPQETVKLGIAKASTPVSKVKFTTPATLTPDGKFAGSLSRGSLGAGKYNVWAQACFASNCGTKKVTITL
jgi:hypothetical protein